MNTSINLKSIVKPRIIAIFDGILVLVIVYAGEKLLVLLGLEFKGNINLILTLILLLLISSSWLIYYMYKFFIIQKALLEFQPDFYSQKEFTRWFDYYANKK